VTPAADVYVHGHHESVLASHRWRTAANSAAYLVPELRAGQRLLDVGCGPATLTCDLAELVAPGQVVGLDSSSAVVDLARAEAATRGVTNLELVVGDAYALPFEDDSFDVVHAHQVLQHLTDPVAALREMRRVTVPGGLVAVRDSDYAAMSWYPASEGLTEWQHLYHEVTHALRAQADAGRYLLSWVQAAGFDPAGLRPGASAWCFATPTERAWWAELWARRCTSSSFAEHARAHGLADDVALEELAEAWQAWGGADDGWFAVLHGEVLARA
jgi:ubiquinone/menaquinone biosynthesis C-methylase UbiE